MRGKTPTPNYSKPLRWSAFGLILAASLALAGYRPQSEEAYIAEAPRTLPPAVNEMIRTALDSQIAPASSRGLDKTEDRAWEAMRGFYQKRQFHPVWFNPQGSRPQARDLVAAIDSLAGEGLDPRLYRKDTLSTAVRDVGFDADLDDPQVQRRLAQAELSLTYAYLTMAAHLASGRLQPAALGVNWHIAPPQPELEGGLEEAMKDGGSILAALRGQTRSSRDYGDLRDALARYEEMAAQGDWPRVGKTLKKGARGAEVLLLRARLAAEGDLESLPAPDDLYDDAVVEGVSRFQGRHGLEPTGKVDTATLTELDVPVEDRIRQLQVNLERKRWMPADFGPRHIAVNIPDYRLQFVENGLQTLEMRVIVGKAQRNKTPVFSGEMTYLVLNPEWNVPQTIIVQEIKPALAKDSSYLRRKGMEVVRGWGKNLEAVDPSTVDLARLGSEYRLRARPGASNPLGQVKFMFPNRFNVYLHDTPSDRLFNASTRALSHGCVRLEKPIDLANAVLADNPKWTPDAVQDAIAAGDSKTVSLREPLPVHIYYLTAWVDEAGTVQFRRDVYGHDAKVAAALSKESLLKLDFNLGPGQLRAELAGGAVRPEA